MALAGYGYRKKITVDHTKVVATLSNFPVLVSITDADLKHTSSGGKVQSFTGLDIVFTDSADTVLPFEIEKYVAATGELVAWVKIASLSHTVDTELYVYYGKAGATNQASPTDVWDNNYKAVFHLRSRYTGAYPNNTATYDMIPLIIPPTNGDEFLIFYRTGADHVGADGKVVKVTWNAATGAWGAASDVYDSAGQDDRNFGGGKIGSTIYLFFSRTQDDGTRIDHGYITSTDNGATWSAYTPITFDAGFTLASPYGSLVQVGSTWYQPMYDYTGPTYTLFMMQSIDDGATWTQGPTIYSGVTAYTEGYVVNLGSNKLLCLARMEPGGPMRQFESTDGGANWTNRGDSNLGSTGSAMGCIGFDGTTITVVYCDRATDILYSATGTVASVFGTPTGWANIFTIATGLAGFSGYPQIAAYGSGYVVAYHDEASVSDSDIVALVLPDDVNDSTSNALVGLPTTGATGATGQVDGGIDFAGADYVNAICPAAFFAFIQNTGIFTLEAWMKLDDYTTDAARPGAGNLDNNGTSDKGFWFGYENRAAATATKELRLFVAKGTAGTPLIDSRSADNSIADNNWHHLICSGDGTNIEFYVDGVHQDGTSTMGAKPTGDSSNANLQIGATPVPLYHLGLLDELRISDIQRSEAWLQTGYNNQSVPGTFATLGSEESFGRVGMRGQWTTLVPGFGY